MLFVNVVAVGGAELRIDGAVLREQAALLVLQAHELIVGVYAVLVAVALLKHAAEIICVEIFAQMRARTGKHNVVIALVDRCRSTGAVVVFLGAVLVTEIHVAADHRKREHGAEVRIGVEKVV